MARQRLLIGLLGGLICSAACGSPSPLSPAPLPVLATEPGPSLPGSLPGVWKGYLSASQCVSNTGCQTARIIPFVLRVASSSGSFIGSIEVENAAPQIFVVDIFGTTQPDGAVLFTGRRDVSAGPIEVRRLLIRTDPMSGLAGEIDVRFLYRNTYHQSLEGQVVSAAYQPFTSLPGQSVSGSWTGRAVITKCEGYCPSYQNEGDEEPMSLVLGQSGATVTGRLELRLFSCGCWLSVAGTANGAAVSLSSERTSANSGNDRMLHLESFDGTLDGLGRITGRFVYAADSRIAISPFDVSYRLEYEIVWLKRD